MPRVTTQQLANEIDTIKNNHLQHMAQDIDELKGKELNAKVKEIQSISKRMKQHQKYLKLLLL